MGDAADISLVSLLRSRTGDQGVVLANVVSHFPGLRCFPFSRHRVLPFLSSSPFGLLATIVPSFIHEARHHSLVTGSNESADDGRRLPLHSGTLAACLCPDLCWDTVCMSARREWGDGAVNGWLGITHHQDSDVPALLSCTLFCSLVLFYLHLISSCSACCGNSSQDEAEEKISRSGDGNEGGRE